jgi:hypothetical protein
MSDFDDKDQDGNALVPHEGQPHMSTDEQMITKLGHLLELDGAPFITLIYEGQAAWPISIVARILGTSVKALLTRLSGSYADELEEGVDYKTLKQSKYNEFKGLFTESVNSQVYQYLFPPRSYSITLLFESALFHILTLSRKPAGKRLRQVLRKQILPNLFRGKTVSLTGPVDVAPAPTEIPEAQRRKLVLDEKAEDRKRIQAQNRSLALRLKAVEALGDSLTDHERKALIFGDDVAPVASTTPEGKEERRKGPTANWKTAGRIAREHGMSGQMVGNLITRIEGRGQPMRKKAPGISVLEDVDIPGGKGTVKTSLYSPKGEQIIIAEIKAWKMEKAEAARFEALKKAKVKGARLKRSQDAVIRAVKRLSDAELFAGFERILENWRDGLGVEFVQATQIDTIVRGIKNHGLDVAQKGVLRALNTDTPHNDNERLKACIAAAAKAATKIG